MFNSLSATQVYNINSAAAIVVMILTQFGVTTSAEKVAFIIAAIWAIGSVCANYLNRWSKGDVTVLGARK